jgi:hypothetical protein
MEEEKGKEEPKGQYGQYWNMYEEGKLVMQDLDPLVLAHLIVTAKVPTERPPFQVGESFTYKCTKGTMIEVKRER